MKNKRNVVVVIVVLAALVLACEGRAGAETVSSIGSGSASVSQNGPLTWSLRPQYGGVLRNTKGDLNVMLEVTGNETTEIKRQPLNLAIVIDRSGSMTGDKISSVKAAALDLLKKLDSGDKVSLLSYSDNVSVHARGVKMTSSGKQRLRSEILRIHAGGGTALGPAVNRAIGVLERSTSRGKPLRHVMLLSDGLANVGESNPQVIGSWTAKAFGHGISLSTLGVGVDYNEDLMTHLADQGGGQYHFIRDNQAIATVLEGELNGLMATVAREMYLEIPNRSGIAVTKAFGYPLTKRGQLTTIKIGSVRAGQTRDIMIRLSVDPGSKPNLLIEDIKLRFRDVTKGSVAVEVKTNLDLTVVASQQAVDDLEDTEVTVRLAEVESAQELELAAREVDNGDYGKAEKVIDRSIIKLKRQAIATPSESLDEQITEMEQAKSDIKKAKTSSVERKAYVKSKKSSAYKKGKSGCKSRKKK